MSPYHFAKSTQEIRWSDPISFLTFNPHQKQSISRASRSRLATQIGGPAALKKGSRPDERELGNAETISKDISRL